MKKFSLLSIAAVLVLTVSCEKPQTEAERNAQVEREVQQRLAAERQADEQQRLAQQQADLAAREQALADREAAANATATPVEQPVVTETRTIATADPDDQPRSYDTFYRKLEPYGAWRETADYGFVWQPQQAQRSRDWRPYTDGRWAYTDVGWTWVSEEPFGWATYHYGRWTHLRGVGWVWVPGDEWAPAWVSWRKSDQYVGWAPLPPEAHFDRRRGIQRWADSYYDIDAGEYVFIPNEAIGSLQVRQEVVPVQQNVTIINQTTNITNITYNNTTIVNAGPNFDELRARSRRPLQRLRLERRANAEAADPATVVRGDVLAVTAPVITAQAAERPRTTAEPIREVAVDRDYNASNDKAETERARQKMKSEATPPPDAPPKKYQKAAVASPTASASAPKPSATASPATTATVTPRPTVTPAPSATLTPRVSATATPAVTQSPIASITPRGGIAPSASVTASASPDGTPSPAATPRIPPPVTKMPTRAASPTSSPTLSPRPTAIAAPTQTPAAESDDSTGSATAPGSRRPGPRPPGAGTPQRRADQLRNPGAAPTASALPSAAPSASSPVPQPAITPRPHVTPPAPTQSATPTSVATSTPFVRPTAPVATPQGSASPMTPPAAQHPGRAQTAPPSPPNEQPNASAPAPGNMPRGRPGGPAGRGGKRPLPPEPTGSATPTVAPAEGSDR